MERIFSRVFKLGFAAILLAAVIAGATERAQAWVWYVNPKLGSGNGTAWTDPFSTISEAVAAAQEGDSIWVAEGEYLIEEPIRINKRLNIYGGFLGLEQCLDERVGVLRTTIDGGNSTACMAISADTLLDGIDFFECNTVVNYGAGKDPSKYLQAAGITIGNSKLTMRRCSMLRSYGAEYGAIRAENCQLDICECRIENSLVTEPLALGAGGMHLLNCSGVISKTALVGNDGKGAGGIYAEGGNLLVDRCQFIANGSGGNNPGGGINISGTHTVQSSLFYRNRGYTGGAGYFNGTTVNRCRMSANSAAETDESITALNAKLYNCIIHEDGNHVMPLISLSNSSLVNSTVFGQPITSSSILKASESRIINSIIWNAGQGQVFDIFSNTSVIYSLISGGQPGEGNIDADPQFVAPESYNFKLQPTSPCVDAGTANIPDLPETDYTGRRRVMGSAPDMGAYELPQLPRDALSRLLLPSKLDGEQTSGGGDS